MKKRIHRSELDMMLTELNKKFAFPLPKKLYEQLLSLRKGKKIKEMRKSNSEDALTWNLFRAFALTTDRDEDKSPLCFPAVYPENSTLEIHFKQTDFYVWDRTTDGKEDMLMRRLKCVLLKCEANPRAFTEIDGIIWDRVNHQLIFFENKLNARFKQCDAMAKGSCRLYRDNKRSRDNGCSYWGEGKGGDAFKSRFPRNLIKEHIGSNFAKPEGKNDESADCYKYYQLMRNFIIGKELSKDLETEFILASIIPKDCINYEANKTTFRNFAEIVAIDNKYAKLLTWQDVMQVLIKDKRRRFKKLSNWITKRAIS